MTAAVDLTATAQAAVIRVNEARKQMGLPPFPDEIGNLSISEYMAQQTAKKESGAKPAENLPHGSP